MTTRMKLLLVLTIVGFVVPNVMLAVFFVEHPGDVGLYFESWFETLPAAQLVADLVIAFVAFTVWAAWDGPRSGVQRWWLVVPASLLVGVCFAVPLYLYMRERASPVTAAGA
jgi:hypothetical protein